MPRIDDSELRDLTARIEGMPLRALVAAEQVMKRGAQNIKNELAQEASQSRSFRQIAPTISYDERRTLRGVEYEIGPDRAQPAARLANIAYFGGANGGGGTLDFDGPARKELPRLQTHLTEALRDSL